MSNSNFNITKLTVDPVTQEPSAAEINGVHFTAGESVEIQTNKTVTISENGTITISPATGYDAMKKVTATVNVPSSGGAYIIADSGYTTVACPFSSVDAIPTETTTSPTFSATNAIATSVISGSESIFTTTSIYLFKCYIEDEYIVFASKESGSEANELAYPYSFFAVPLN